MNHNEADVWRLSWEGGTQWGFYINCIDGWGHRHLVGYSGTGYSDGTVVGETGRYASSQVHMANRHTDLRFKNSAGTWVNWNDNNCLFDDAPEWRSWKLTTQRYEVDWGDETNCVL